MDDSETVTASPQEIAELEEFVSEKGDEIAEKFRHLLKEDVIANPTYLETKNFRVFLHFAVIVHDETDVFDHHLGLLKYHAKTVNDIMNIPAQDLTTGLKAIKDLLDKYECGPLALEVETKLNAVKHKFKKLRENTSHSIFRHDTLI